MTTTLKSLLTSWPNALLKVGEISAFGKQKYGDNLYYKTHTSITENLECALRHTYKHLSGVYIDEESRLLHLAHAACRLLMALEVYLSAEEILNLSIKIREEKEECEGGPNCVWDPQI